MCVYVRELSMAEGRRLQSILRRDHDRVRVRRAQVVLASAQGQRVPAIARQLYFSAQHVRTIIRAFNAEGFAALDARPRPGRPVEFSEEQCSLIVETALCPPDLLGRPFRSWSLGKLREYLVDEGIVASIGIETLRQMLRKAKVRLQRTKTWKVCNDPRLAAKKKRSAGT
jgi:transposase